MRSIRQHHVLADEDAEVCLRLQHLSCLQVRDNTAPDEAYLRLQVTTY